MDDSRPFKHAGNDSGDRPRFARFAGFAGFVCAGSEDSPEADALIQSRTKVKRPSLYKVLLLNDEETPMEFVVHVLEKFFGKNEQEAMDIMLHVHRSGVGVCGVYTYEVAETKVTQVMDYAREHEHPLQCTLEKE